MNEAIDIFNQNEFEYPDQEAITLAKNKKYFLLDNFYNMGNYQKGHTKVLCVLYRRCKEIKEFYNVVCSFKTQKLFEKMERIISTFSQIQNSHLIE